MALSLKELPGSLQAVLENTKPIATTLNGRLPLFVLPISGSLSSLPDGQAEKVLNDLAKRGIGYSVNWNHGSFDASLKEGLRIGELQQRLGRMVSVHATGCLYSFFDGTEKTQHIDAGGRPFGETSFGGTMGCPFALEHRIPVIRQRVEAFLKQYKAAGVDVDFIFADWEIDGPIEWNDAWASSKCCRRCREHVPDIHDFRSFQTKLREVRSRLQREAFSDNVTRYFPEALVGNYAVYPHNGHRYWYDYFERETPGAPALTDQRARYREWNHEFEHCGYTFAMPVVYTWYPTFGWYDFEPKDYRWFFQNNSKEILDKSQKDLKKATSSTNINIDYIARAYMTLSDIFLLNHDLQNADRAIKRALRANKRIDGVIDKLKNINKIKLQ